MKNQVIIALAFLVSTISFAQKKELKAVEKAIKSNNYSEAKAGLSQVEPMLSGLDGKTKSQYYLLNAKALYAAGAGSSVDIDKALESLTQVTEGYDAEVAQLKQEMVNNFLTKGNTAYEKKEFELASVDFENAYRISTKDTVYLYYAAATSVNQQDYDRALVLYEELKKLKYTGIEQQFFAINKETNEEEVMTKAQRDLFVKTGKYVNPGERITESKLPEITKNIAMIYMQQKKTDQALAAIKDARNIDPENVDLIMNEASLYLQLENSDKFAELMREAIQKQPKNASLHYNIGVVNLNNMKYEDARDSFSKALEIDPSYVDAALNISTTYINEGNALIEVMNKLGTSAADNKKYDELKDKKTSLFEKGAEVLEEFLRSNPAGDVNIYEQLKNIYNALGEVQKAKEVKLKLEALQN